MPRVRSWPAGLPGHGSMALAQGSVRPLSETQESASKKQSDFTIPWLRASVEDVSAVDFEAPLTVTTAYEWHELTSIFEAAGGSFKDVEKVFDTPESRVFSMLAGICSMQFKPQDYNDPFGPKMVLPDGRRSATTSDFRSHVDTLEELAKRSSHLSLRARLADVCWVLDRKRGKLGLAAVAAYVEVAQGWSDHAFCSTENIVSRYGPQNDLHRALVIGDKVGRDKPETVAARSLVERFRRLALTEAAFPFIQWSSALDLKFGVSDAAEIGASLDRVLAGETTGLGVYGLVDLWKLAARAYHLARMENDRDRCLSQAAETLVAQAEAKQISAFQASHLLSSAIAQLHGIPGKRDRRKELRHKLIEVQAGVTDEMGVFSQDYDVQDIADKIQQAFANGTLLDKLLIFASLAKSPDPEKLASDASKAIQDNPLASLFSASHLDHEGKVIHRTPGGRDASGFSDGTIFQQVAKTDEIRRQLVVSGRIEPARHSIIDRHFVTDDLLASLLQPSGFVPDDLVATFSRGFSRFFQGDFVSATYILTPLLENSLRYVLKSHGHDVTKFDDATETQEDRTISSLFDQMRAELNLVLTPAITADIERVFLIKPGPHLRHAVSHGLLHDSGPYGADAVYACWLIFRLSLISLFRETDQLRLIFSGTELCAP